MLAVQRPDLTGSGHGAVGGAHRHRADVTRRQVEPVVIRDGTRRVDRHEVGELVGAHGDRPTVALRHGLGGQPEVRPARAAVAARQQHRGDRRTVATVQRGRDHVDLPGAEPVGVREVAEVTEGTVDRQVARGATVQRHVQVHRVHQGAIGTEQAELKRSGHRCVEVVEDRGAQPVETLIAQQHGA